MGRSDVGCSDALPKSDSVFSAHGRIYLDAEVGGLCPAVCCAGCLSLLRRAGATLLLLLGTGMLCVR